MRTKRNVWLTLVALSLLSPGCTLLVDASQYVGNGVDGGTVGDVGPRPDGGDGGSGANERPRVLGVGLDDYRPAVGETVRALVGGVVDPEGDATTTSYRWYRNGSVVSGMTANNFPTAGLAAGDTVHAEVWASDAMGEGVHVLSADATVIADESRWEQLLPSEGSGLPVMAWDEEARRIVRWVNGGLWEYRIAGNGLTTVRLPFSGTPPPAGENVASAIDPLHHRILVTARSLPGMLFALDYSRPGAESWSTTSVPGLDALPFFGVSVYDESEQRIVCLGGVADPSGPPPPVFALSVRNAGSETVTPLSMADPPRLFAAAAAPDPTTPGRFWILGGVEPSPTSGNPAVLRTHPARLDITGTDAVLTELSTTAPTMYGPGAAALAASGHILTYGGVDALPDTGVIVHSVPPQVFDPASGNFTEVGGTAPHLAVLAQMVPLTGSPGTFAVLTFGGDLLGDTVALQYDEVSESALRLVAAEVRPAIIVDAAAQIASGQVTVYFGRAASHDGASEDIWTLDLARRHFALATPAPDGTTSTSPVPRFGIVMDNSPYGNSTYTLLVGGSRASDTLADMVPFELRSEGWVQHTVTSGAPLPQRTGHLVFRVPCGNTALGVVGGVDASRNYLDDAANLNCTSDHSCQWATSSGVLPSPRASAAAFATDRVLYGFGGEGGTGALGDSFTVDICFSSPQAHPVTVTGTPPSARFGHTMTAAVTTGGETLRGLLFGGTTASGDSAEVYEADVSVDYTMAWRPIVVGGELPPPRHAHVAVWDATGQRLIVLGGSVDVGFGRDSSDVWALTIR